MTRIIVAGGRDFEDYPYLCEKMDSVLQETGDDIEIVSGHAKGADSLGERYGRERGIPVVEFRADWKRYGRNVGPVRNQQMLDYAEEARPVVVAFWDGKSKGTGDTILRASRKGITLKVHPYGST